MPDTHNKKPQTIDQAVDHLLGVLSLREKTEISKMAEDDIPQLHLSLGVYIRSELTHWSQDEKLIKEAKQLLSSQELPYLDIVSNAVCLALWRKLQKVHALRLVR